LAEKRRLPRRYQTIPDPNAQTIRELAGERCLLLQRYQIILDPNAQTNLEPGPNTHVDSGTAVDCRSHGSPTIDWLSS
jgi:hypothetical protein